MSTIQQRLRKAREDAGMTQQEVADILQFSSQASISDIERGRTTHIDLEDLARYFKAIGADANKVLGVRVRG